MEKTVATATFDVNLLDLPWVIDSHTYLTVNFSAVTSVSNIAVQFYYTVEPTPGN